MLILLFLFVPSPWLPTFDELSQREKCTNVLLYKHVLVEISECFHVRSVVPHVFMSISVSMCRPAGLSCEGTLAIRYLCFSNPYMRVYACVLVRDI